MRLNRGGLRSGRHKKLCTITQGIKWLRISQAFWVSVHNGVGELLAFDARGSQPWPIVMVPFLPMETDEVVQIAGDIDEFTKAIGAPEDDR